MTITKINMSQVDEIARNLGAAGIPPEFGVDNSRMLIKTWRKLALGNPVTMAEVGQISEDLEIPFGQVDEFLRGATERDSDDNIVGLMGLSLNSQWAHRFKVNGQTLRTWCAWDTLFLPAMVDSSVVIESEAPVSGTTVRLELRPKSTLT